MNNPMILCLFYAMFGMDDEWDTYVDFYVVKGTKFLQISVRMD